MNLGRTPSPSFKGLSPSSTTASRIARAGSAKRDTKPEMLLRQALWRAGARYRLDVSSIAGRPDLVFRSAKLVVFCDGDFWHGREIKKRLGKLSKGHNASYWVSKIRANVARDRRIDRILRGSGWTVLRLWEGDIHRNAAASASVVLDTLKAQRLLLSAGCRGR